MQNEPAAPRKRTLCADSLVVAVGSIDDGDDPAHAQAALHDFECWLRQRDTNVLPCRTTRSLLTALSTAAYHAAQQLDSDEASTIVLVFVGDVSDKQATLRFEDGKVQLRDCVKALASGAGAAATRMSLFCFFDTVCYRVGPHRKCLRSESVRTALGDESLAAVHVVWSATQEGYNGKYDLYAAMSTDTDDESSDGDGDRNTAPRAAALNVKRSTMAACLADQCRGAAEMSLEQLAAGATQAWHAKQRDLSMVRIETFSTPSGNLTFAFVKSQVAIPSPLPLASRPTEPTVMAAAAPQAAAAPKLETAKPPAAAAAIGDAGRSSGSPPSRESPPYYYPEAAAATQAPSMRDAASAPVTPTPDYVARGLNPNAAQFQPPSNDGPGTSPSAAPPAAIGEEEAGGRYRPVSSSIPTDSYATPAGTSRGQSTPLPIPELQSVYAAMAARNNDRRGVHYCNVCQCDVFGDANWQLHLTSEKHRRKELLTNPDIAGRLDATSTAILVNPKNFCKCDLCGVVISGQANIYQHMNGQQHRRNAERFGVPVTATELPPMQPQAPTPSADPVFVARHRCNVCQKTFETEGQLLTHYGTMEHQLASGNDIFGPIGR